MSENEKFEIRTETTVTFGVFREFYNCMVSMNKINGFFLKASPYIFLTGLFFCFLDMILFKEDSVGPLLLIVVLLMGAFMVMLYVAPPRAVYKANEKEFSLPYKYIFTEKGFSVGRENFNEEMFIPYSNLNLIFESETAFYFGYQRKTCIVEKSNFPDGKAALLSSVLKAENPRKYSKIKG